MHIFFVFLLKVNLIISILIRIEKIHSTFFYIMMSPRELIFEIAIFLYLFHLRHTHYTASWTLQSIKYLTVLIKTISLRVLYWYIESITLIDYISKTPFYQLHSHLISSSLGYLLYSLVYLLSSWTSSVSSDHASFAVRKKNKRQTFMRYYQLRVKLKMPDLRVCQVPKE